MTSKLELFPPLTSKDVLDCQFSSWYPKFSRVSIKSTVIKPLPDNFLDYLQSDGVFAPKGSDDRDSEPNSSHSSEQGDDSEDEPLETSSPFAFPDLDEKIRGVILDYGSVFPKLNWSAPKDAQWMLSTTEFMRCTSPAEVYLAFKASDFIQHDLVASSAFEGVKDIDVEAIKIPLELVLRKWYSFDRSREFRCFVRDGVLIAACQRDMVFYDFLATPTTRSLISGTIQTFWKEQVQKQWERTNYVFDILLTRNLEKAHIVDFNPFAPKTDSLLFTYEELSALFIASGEPGFSAELRIIDTPSHPYANLNAPQNRHNMVPLDALALSSGRDASDYATAFADAIQRANAEL